MEATIGKKKQITNNTIVKRGDVFWVNLNPTVGAEIQKIRPGLIVANDTACQYAQILLIAPITSKKIDVISPFEVTISLNGKLSKILLNQCRAIDRSRLSSKITSVDLSIMRLVDEAIKIAFGL